MRPLNYARRSLRKNRAREREPCSCLQSSQLSIITAAAAAVVCDFFIDYHCVQHSSNNNIFFMTTFRSLSIDQVKPGR
jgi:hypothetical protein